MQAGEEMYGWRSRLGACPPPAPEDHISGLAPGACQVGWTGAEVRIAIRNLRLAVTLMSHRCPLKQKLPSQYWGIGKEKGRAKASGQH